MMRLTARKIHYVLAIVLMLSITVLGLHTPNVHSATNTELTFQGKIVRNDAGSEGLNVSSGETSCISGGADTCDFRAQYYDASSGGTLLATEVFSDVEIGDFDGVFLSLIHI